MGGDTCVGLIKYYICLSNKTERERTIDEVIKHLKSHQNVTHLHFWLADGQRSFCECDKCQKLRVADYYVKMLNELDEKLTAENLNTKIVFCVFYCTLWAPIKERIKNPDRFLLMLAPITRRYSVPLQREDNVKMAEYKLNKSEFPLSGPENVEYLCEWQKVFDGDCVDFDYHFVWDQFKEFSHHQLSRVVYEDIRHTLEYADLYKLRKEKIERVFADAKEMHAMIHTLCIQVLHR